MNKFEGGNENLRGNSDCFEKKLLIQKLQPAFDHKNTPPT